MKKIFLYTLLGVLAFSIGFFAIDIAFKPTNAVYKDNTQLVESYEDKSDEKDYKLYVNNVDITNLSYNDAVLKLNNAIDLDKEKLTIIIENEKYENYFNEIMLSYDYSNAIKEASLNKENEILSIQASVLFEDEIIYKIVDKLKEVKDVPLTKDEIVLVEDKFLVTTNNTGKVLDREKAFNKISEELQEGNTTIILELEETNNQELLKDINNYMTKIGTGTTKYSGSTNGRITNLQVASNSLNGSYVYPGEVFSTNNNFSPYTTEKGYRNAGIIVAGEIVDGLGGGVCQVSSTLYMALLYSELDIVERYNHSLKVGYMDYGFDAVLASTYKDLKFKNDTSKPIYIESYVGDGQVIVNIYGEEIHDESRNLKFTNELVRSIAPKEPVIVEDDNMYIGEEFVKIKPLYGHEYNVYKHIYDGDTHIETVFIDTSVYSSRAEERHVGIKEKEQSVVEEIDNMEMVEVDNIQINDIEENLTTEVPILEEDNLITEVQVEEENLNAQESGIEEANLNIELPLEEEVVNYNNETVDNNFNDEPLVANNEEIQEIIENNSENN